MKTMKAGAVVLLGLVLAAPAWSAPQRNYSPKFLTASPARAI